MFTASRQTALDGLDAIGSRLCVYGTWPDGRCDCKYGYDGSQSPSSEQTGCPELRTLRLLVRAMSDNEWALLERRAGGIPSGSFAASAEDMRLRLLRADAAARMASENISIVRDLLSFEVDGTEQEHER